MKINKAISLGVQSLGRQDPSLTRSAGKGAAIAEAVSGVQQGLITTANVLLQVDAKLEADREKAKRQREKSIRIWRGLGELSAKREMQQSDILLADTERTLTDQYSGLSHIPMNMIPGELQTPEMQNRGSIPKSEIYPQIYDYTMKQAMEQGKGLISQDIYKDEWGNQAELNFLKNSNRVLDRESKAHAAYILDAQAQDVEGMQNSGLFDMAASIIDSMSIPVEDKKNLLAENAEDKEEWEIDLAISTGDVQEMQELFNELSQPDYDGAIENPDKRIALRNKIRRELSNHDERNISLETAYKERLVSETNELRSAAMEGNVTDMTYAVELLSEIRLAADTDPGLTSNVIALEKSLVFFGLNNDMASLNFSERLDYIEEVREDANNTEELSMFLTSNLTNSHDSIVRQENTDMMQRAVDSGFVQELVPISISNDIGTMVSQMEARKAQHDMIKAKYGRSQGLFTKQEVIQISAVLNDMDATQKLDFITANAAVFGVDSDVIYNQLELEGSTAAFATAGMAVVNGTQSQAIAILRGNEYRVANRSDSNLNNLEALLDAEFNKDAGMVFLHNPEYRNTMREVYKDAFYGYKLGQNQDPATSQSFSSGWFAGDDIINQAMVAAFGGLVEQRGIALQAPVYGMQQDEWDTWIHELDSSYIQGARGENADVIMKDIRNGDIILQTGAQRGEFYLLNNRTQIPIQGFDNNAYVFIYNPNAPKRELRTGTGNISRQRGRRANTN